MGEPYFVVRINRHDNRVVIGKQHELGRKNLTADQTNWLVDQLDDGSAIAVGSSFSCLAQIRYNSPAADATVRLLEEDRFEVTFDDPRFGVAPGQAVVCYDNDRVLGGGWIE